jgi:hypothetical protein
MTHPHPKICGTCLGCRLRLPSDKSTESGHKEDTHWCALLQMPTKPDLLRCGGDDYQPQISR